MNQASDNNITVMSVFGTRPEAIKMGPVVKCLGNSNIRSVVGVTGQHREMLDQVLEIFRIVPDFNLNLMRPNQGLTTFFTNCLLLIEEFLINVKPDMVLVHGDTSSAVATAIAAFYQKIPVAHVEAGLRTTELYSPFPEEFNRQVISRIAKLHFAPTENARCNLLKENVDRDDIFVTGNTVIDALHEISKELAVPAHLKRLFLNKKMILMTAHRRENFGEPFDRICSAVKNFAIRNPGFQIIYPVHPNPNVFNKAYDLLGNIDNIKLIEPVSYLDLIYLLKECLFVLTDSGGIQEEACALGKPLLILRETTERPEVILAGCGILVGSNGDLIQHYMSELSQGEYGKLFLSMSKAVNPFGDGTASEKIVKSILSHFDQVRATEEFSFNQKNF